MENQVKNPLESTDSLPPLKPKIVLKAENICKSFSYPKETKILKDINLSLYEGESIAIMGKSGEGKSTLLQILGTIETPTSGTLQISNIDVSSKNYYTVRNLHIGFVFQTFHLLENYSVIENILMPAFIARKPIHVGSIAYKKAEQLLEKVGLSERKSYPTKLLSGGEKQRVAIARSFCNHPNLIFADEPTGNLDHHTSEDIHQLLFDFSKEFNKTLIIVTHDQDLASKCDKQYLLEDQLLSKL